MSSEITVDKFAFSEAIIDASSCSTEQGGIGTLGEKLLHKTLKFYFEPDESRHEVSCFGSVADIYNGDGIIEIQTRSLNKLAPKLERFLPNEKVTVVYPIIERKTICRVDKNNGEFLYSRKSWKRGKKSDALGELSMIRKFIPHEKLRILIVFVDVNETRISHGKLCVGARRTQKLNCIPTEINSIISLESPDDFRALLPEELPERFTAAEFESLSKLRDIKGHGALMLLLKLGILSRTRKGRDPYLYSINPT